MALNSYKWDEITPITEAIYHWNPINIRLSWAITVYMILY
jgi:hypothetical protein